ncbi:hypothetical protein WJX84_001098 [Apatococcus fuscideae]|uniref:Leydig cell tumor 10 kDa protein homolog n=1 Tax=Apatococcus fuscideae TaxID=2026836 RepID=A0AAW1T4N2_9CHLO
MAQKALFKSQKKPKPKGPPANRHGKVVKHKGGEAEAVPRSSKEKFNHLEQQGITKVINEKNEQAAAGRVGFTGRPLKTVKTIAPPPQSSKKK